MDCIQNKMRLKIIACSSCRWHHAGVTCHLVKTFMNSLNLDIEDVVQLIEHRGEKSL